MPADPTFVVGRDLGLTSPAILSWRRDAGTVFRSFSRLPRERVGWLTVLGDPFVHVLGEPFPAMSEHVDRMRRKMISRCKRTSGGIRVRGVFEFDLLHRRQIADGGHKEAFFQSCGIVPSVIPPNTRICLPHLHAVVDLGRHQAAVVRRHFAAEFIGPWRVVMRPLHDDKTVLANLSALANYSTKLKAAYSNWHPDRSTKFGPAYEPQCLRLLEAFVHEVGLNNMLFRHGSRKH